MNPPGRGPFAEDTSPEAERAWFDMLRAKGPAWRLEQTFALASEVHRLALAAFDRMRPEATPGERREWLIRECHGDELAERWLALRRRTGCDAHT